RAALAAGRKTPPSCGNRAGTNRKRVPRKMPGERYTPCSLHHAIMKACEKANATAIEAAREAGHEVADDAVLVPAWFPYQLRHTHATEVRRRFGLEAAQATLGPSQANVTQLYAERDLSLAVKVAQAMG